MMHQYHNFKGKKILMTNSLTKDKSGFTIVEVLIAVALLATALLALGALATSNMKAVEVSKRQTQAINLATEKIEMLEVISYNLLGFDHNTDPLVSGNSIERTCDDPVTTILLLPEIICTPVLTPIVYDNMDFNWNFTVYYLDFDNDGNSFITNSTTEIDRGDIKKTVVKIWWTDIYGYHEIELESIRGRAT